MFFCLSFGLTVIGSFALELIHNVARVRAKKALGSGLVCHESQVIGLYCAHPKNLKATKTHDIRNSKGKQTVFWNFLFIEQN